MAEQVQDALWWTLYQAEGLLKGSSLRQTALAECMKLIHYEVSQIVHIPYVLMQELFMPGLLAEKSAASCLKPLQGALQIVYKHTHHVQNACKVLTCPMLCKHTRGFRLSMLNINVNSPVSKASSMMIRLCSLCGPCICCHLLI